MKDIELVKNKKFSKLDDEVLSAIEGGKNQLAYDIGYAAGKLTGLAIQLIGHKKRR